MAKTKLKVGTDWTSCPCCHANYLTSEPHHRACPVSLSAAMCRFCGALHSQTHHLGCPHATGLFPILYREASSPLECARCNTRFEIGDCFVAGKVAILCVGCGWCESAEIQEAGS